MSSSSTYNLSDLFNLNSQENLAYQLNPSDIPAESIIDNSFQYENISLPSNLIIKFFPSNSNFIIDSKGNNLPLEATTLDDVQIWFNKLNNTIDLDEYNDAENNFAWGSILEFIDRTGVDKAIFLKHLYTHPTLGSANGEDAMTIASQIERNELTGFDNLRTYINTRGWETLYRFPFYYLPRYFTYFILTRGALPPISESCFNLINILVDLHENASLTTSYDILNSQEELQQSNDRARRLVLNLFPALESPYKDSILPFLMDPNPERLGTNDELSPYWYTYIYEYLRFLDDPVKVDINKPIEDALDNLQLIFQNLNDYQIYDIAKQKNIIIRPLLANFFPFRSAWAADCGNILSNGPVTDSAYLRALEP